MVHLSASQGPTHMHLFHHMPLFRCYHRDRAVILPTTFAFFTDDFRMKFTPSDGQNGSLEEKRGGGGG